MEVLVDSEIRIRAYLNWEAAGRPILDSNEERNAFWFAAQKELLEEMALAEETESKKIVEVAGKVEAKSQAVEQTSCSTHNGGDVSNPTAPPPRPTALQTVANTG